VDNYGRDGRLLTHQNPDGTFTVSEFVAIEGIPVTEDIVHVASSGTFVNLTNGSIVPDDTPAGVLRAVPLPAVIMFAAAAVIFGTAPRR
jgi:hypothetical protein